MSYCEHLEEKKDGSLYCLCTDSEPEAEIGERCCRSSENCLYCPHHPDYNGKELSEIEDTKKKKIKLRTVLSTVFKKIAKFFKFLKNHPVVAGIFAFIILILVIFLSRHGKYVMIIDIPDGIKARDISLTAVCTEGDNLYKTSSKRFKKNGKCVLSMPKGENQIYITYKGQTIYLDTVDAKNFKRQKNDDWSFDTIKDELMRVVIVELQDKNGNPIVKDTVTVYEDVSKKTKITHKEGNCHIIPVSDNAKEVEFTLEVDGYQPVVIKADVSDRLAKVIVKLVVEK